MRGLRGAPAVLLVACVAACVAGCATSPPATAPPARPTPTEAAAVGALFDGPATDLGDHYCSGSVVDSPAGALVLTAAHCVAAGDGTPARTGMSFVPGYHDGVRPHGVWTVASAAVDPQFLADGDPDFDVAFLTVQPAEGAGPVQDVTGGFPIAFDPGAGDDVRAIGYPDEDAGPIVRSGVTQRFSPTQLVLPAPGLEDGTSGGPWLRASPDGPEIVGLTGGYEQGGYSFDTSYSTYLAGSFAALRDQAAQG
ncbi:trypsin-like peptidase domain-containing protein [Pseudonocardia sp. NPDC049154]|uniref:trypsin-like serine peptidase n=1 Tax=Pseudonocardia sp. NPDC049154 TaxID=3155501 RepID=UPI0033F34BAB